MSLLHMAVLFFAICTTDSDEICEEGQVWARSCAHAERYIRDALRPGQVLLIQACEPAQ